MPIENRWERFTHTGRVEDYLSYVAEQKTDQKNGKLECEKILGCIAPKIQLQGEERAGADPYAGIYMGNRDGSETDTCGGI